MPPLSFSRFNATVIGVLGIFAFVYFTVTSCVVSKCTPTPGMQCLSSWASDSCVSHSTVLSRPSTWQSRPTVLAQVVPWLSFSVPGVLNFSVLTFNTALALSCFLTCVVIDPGR